MLMDKRYYIQMRLPFMSPSTERPRRGLLTAEILLAIAIVMIAAIACSLIANNDDQKRSVDDKGVCSGDIHWQLFSDGDLVISGSGDMDDYTDADGQPWYDHRGEIVKVTVSEGITSIGDRAFEFFGHMVSITLPSTLTSIGEDAISYCTELQTVTIPDKVTSIGEYAFRYTGITSISIPDGVTAIERGTFLYCYDLSAADIPDSVTSIGAEAFLGCIDLEDVYITGSLTAVSADAFTDTHLKESDGSTPAIIDTEHLKGAYFKDCVKTAVGLSIDGRVCSIASDTQSASITAGDVTYIKKKASVDSEAYLRFSLKDDMSATFGKDAIMSIGDSGATASVEPVDKSSLDETTKKLVGDCPVFRLSYSGMDPGDGKVRVSVPCTIPEGRTADGLKAFIVENGEVTGSCACTFADGKATFDTDGASTFYIDYGSTPNDGKKDDGFPVWIAVIAGIAAVVVIAGMVLIRKRK